MCTAVLIVSCILCPVYSHGNFVGCSTGDTTLFNVFVQRETIGFGGKNSSRLVYLEYRVCNRHIVNMPNIDKIFGKCSGLSFLYCFFEAIRECKRFHRGAVPVRRLRLRVVVYHRQFASGEELC